MPSGLSTRLPTAPASGCSSAQRTSADSHPGCASASSCSSTTNSPVAAARPRLAPPAKPRLTTDSTTVASAPAARSRTSSAAPLSTTTVSNSGSSGPSAASDARQRSSPAAFVVHDDDDRRPRRGHRTRCRQATASAATTPSAPTRGAREVVAVARPGDLVALGAPPAAVRVAEVVDRGRLGRERLHDLVELRGRQRAHPVEALAAADRDRHVEVAARAQHALELRHGAQQLALGVLGHLRLAAVVARVGADVLERRDRHDAVVRRRRRTAARAGRRRGRRRRAAGTSAPRARA